MNQPLIYSFSVNEAAAQLIVALLRTRPHGEVDDLVSELRAQAQAQEAAHAARARQAVIDAYERELEKQAANVPRMEF